VPPVVDRPDGRQAADGRPPETSVICSGAVARLA
jgi:hypothetical protein